MQHRGERGVRSRKNATEGRVIDDRLVKRRPSGVLDLRAGRRWFDTAQYRPAPELSELIEHYWRVHWDMGDHEPYTQDTLSNASVHLVVERGRSQLLGIVTGRFTRVLEGRGRVFGVKFRPAGFHAFGRSPVSKLTNRSLAVAEVFGQDGDALVERVLGLEDNLRIVEAYDAFFRAKLPAPDPNVGLLNGLVARIVGDRNITTVELVAREAGIGKRTMQRLFSEYVGVSPKWVIRRYRLHEAEERLAAGEDVDLAALALDLGYYDQAHFAKDFCAIVGRPPAAYRRGAAETD
ncbi:MAG: helix-turn-helix domain-containing protein [Candidatus Dormibacteraeota bacterium]|nr:helix-turn-helix domain-containing protein [Candidatus Dormibacteraeota bacterium]